MPEPRQSEKSPDAFRTISEVADDLELPQHVLRFWETRFTQIKPVKRAGGRRFYRPDDVDLLRGIRHLLYSEGYTIKGVQKILKDNGVRHVQGIGLDSDGAPYHVQDLEPPAPPAPAAPRGDAPTGLGGILGFLPRRRGKAAEPADRAAAHFEPHLTASPASFDQPSLFGEPLDAERAWSSASIRAESPVQPDRAASRPERPQARQPRGNAPQPQAERRDPAWDLPEDLPPPVQRSLWAEPAASAGAPRPDLHAASDAGWASERSASHDEARHDGRIRHDAMPPYDRRPEAAGDGYADPAGWQRSEPPVHRSYGADEFEGDDFSDGRETGAGPYGRPPEPEVLRRHPVEPPRTMAAPSQAQSAPIVQRRPTRGPASRIPEPPMKPELEDPLLPFFDDEALAPPEQQISEPLEARIRRMKDHPAGPPEEYIPARARRREVYEPPFVPLEPAPGLGPFSGPMEEYDPHALAQPLPRSGVLRDPQHETHAEFGWTSDADWDGGAPSAQDPGAEHRSQARQPRYDGAASGDPAPRGPLRQGPPEQYLPPHLRSEPRMIAHPPAQAMPVLSRDDVHRLQATLYELGECRRLLTAAGAPKDDAELAD